MAALIITNFTCIGCPMQVQRRHRWLHIDILSDLRQVSHCLPQPTEHLHTNHLLLRQRRLLVSNSVCLALEVL